MACEYCVDPDGIPCFPLADAGRPSHSIYLCRHCGSRGPEAPSSQLRSNSSLAAPEMVDFALLPLRRLAHDSCTSPGLHTPGETHPIQPSPARHRPPLWLLLDTGQPGWPMGCCLLVRSHCLRPNGRVLRLHQQPQQSRPIGIRPFRRRRAHTCPRPFRGRSAVRGAALRLSLGAGRAMRGMGGCSMV